ncbi:primase-helicase family protein [Arcobacter peruensis]|uniref:primase-helicase family protein n=1 Tax=Arcobacter peruensis TaxID=2320140 RepID=UPI0013DEAABD|nr:primase-helicase family protein [Arcobacter peruensis]
MKSRLYANYFFDAIITTFLHGGKRYLMDFDFDDICSILEAHKGNEKIYKIIKALAFYLLSANKNLNFIKSVANKVREITADAELSEYFEGIYDTKYLEKKASKYIKDYALIQTGGKVGFIAKNKLQLEIYSKGDLKIKLENKKIKAPFSKKLSNPIDIFISSENREEYNSIVFKSQENVKPHEYNLFKGWPYRAIKKVDTILYWSFVKKAIAADDDLLFNVIKAWMAQIIQDPFSKVGTALVITGEKGVGKGTFVKVFGSLFGDYFMESADPKRIFGSFNVHLQTCILLYGNEAFWSGQKADEAKLKNLVTDIDQTYEIKGSLTYNGENYTHLILDSNSDHVVHLTFDERRWTNTETSSIYRGNIEFFIELNKLVKTKEFKESLMHDLVHFDYKPWEKHLRKAPQTKAGLDQLLHSLDLYEEWWYQVLENGAFGEYFYIRDNDNSIRISNEVVHKSFKDFIKDNSKRNFDNTATFTKAIKKRFLSETLIISDTIKSNDGKNAKIIASLDKCRSYFSTKYGIEIKSAIMEWQIPKNSIYLSQGY